jgi:hypothetical protein
MKTGEHFCKRISLNVPQSYRFKIWHPRCAAELHDHTPSLLGSFYLSFSLQQKMRWANSFWRRFRLIFYFWAYFNSPSLLWIRSFSSATPHKCSSLFWGYYIYRSNRTLIGRYIKWNIHGITTEYSTAKLCAFQPDFMGRAKT